MSLQLPTILSPPTSCTPGPHPHCSPQVRSRSYRASLSGRLPFWASPLASRLANASGRIEFIIFLIMDWSFASGCSPPRLSATQFPSATDSQCSVRWGLPPHCWCALSGALAWHEVPGTAPPQKSRPGGYGVMSAGVRTDWMTGVTTFRARTSSDTNLSRRVFSLP